MRIAVLIVLWLCSRVALPAQPAGDTVLSAWLDAHQKLKTWSAEVVQTRHLAALAQPLVSTGRVWYCRPGLFRWELGTPSETIAIRSTNELLLVYPELKRAERYPLDRDKGGPLREALTMMEAGFPKDEVSLRKRYSISTQQPEDGLCRIVLEPRASAARQLVDRVALTFQTNVFSLIRTEIQFADGSRLENQFTHSVGNRPLPPNLFSTNLSPDYKLVEPFSDNDR